MDAGSHDVVLSAGTWMTASTLGAMESTLLPLTERSPSRVRHHRGSIEPGEYDFEDDEDDDSFMSDSLPPSRIQSRRPSRFVGSSDVSGPLMNQLGNHRRSCADPNGFLPTSLRRSSTDPNGFMMSRLKNQRRSSALQSSGVTEHALGEDTPPESRRSSLAMGPMISRVVSHRRSSRYQARRMSLLNNGSRITEELSVNPATVGGFLYDFIIRSKLRPLFAYDQQAQGLTELCSREHYLEYDPKGEHADAVAVMLKEGLVREISRFLTPELKNRGPERGGFAITRKGRLREIATIIRKNKRAVKCLEAEVRSWKNRSSLARRQAHNDAETRRCKFQKLEKVVGLWLDYHGRTWNTDEAITPIVSPEMSPSRLKAPPKTLGSSHSLPSFASAEVGAPDVLSPSLAGKTHLPPLAARPLALKGRSPTGDLATSKVKGFGGGDRLPAVASRVKYLGACDGHFIPKTLTFITGHSTSLEAAGRNLLDHDLLAIVDALPAATIDAVDLTGCRSLSDKSLVPLLGSLLKNQAKKTLRKLIIRQCVRAALGTQNMVVELLHTIEGLRHLDLSSIQITMKYQWPLCEAIREHAYLETAILSGIGLGHSPQTKDCIVALGMSKLRTLDIGGNRFSVDEFLSFVERLRDNDWIRSLSLPHASAKKEGPDCPVSYFLEHLAYVKPLRHLDVSMNQMDYQSALVLEDALERHQQLTQIDVSGNNLGILGMRSVLRLVSQSHSGLMHFDITDSWHGMGPTGERVLIFRTTNPSGRYDFDLTRPYHRSFLRMLYKSCERFNITPEQAFQGVVYSNGSYKHPSKDGQGIRLVPTQGTISFTFNVERGIEAETQGVQDEDFVGFLRKHYTATRFRIAFDKSIPILACWRGLTGLESVQSNFLRALSADFDLTLPQLEVMCEKCKSRSDEIISMLFPALPVDSLQRFFVQSILPSCALYLATEPRTRQLTDLNLENPTGHYNLDLGQSCDFAVAQHLLLLDRWEVLVDGRRRRYDISSRGTRSHLRNEHYRSIPLLSVCESISEWNLPEVDWFEFDYASSMRPPPGVEVLSDKTFNVMLTELSDCTAPPMCKISVLRTLSSNFYLTAMQLRQMLGMFRTKQERAEAFVIFFLRIVDMCNAKVFLVRFGGSDEKLKLQRRLGYAAFFPFIQPENEHFDLDLTFHDQRVCCMLLVTLSLHEKAGNIREPRYILADGTEDPLTQGVPRSWETYEKVPTSGVFSASYVCAPDDRQFDMRKKLGQTYGYFKITVQPQQVLWWTGLSEPPRDVIVFLEFLIQKTTSADKAFSLVDIEGNGIVTLRTLEDAIADMQCDKFDGEDKYDRIEVIFRYLDPGQEGSVTRDEWEVIKQLWNEFEHTVCEYTQFLVRTFGDDLTETWEVLHEELGIEDLDAKLDKEMFSKASEDLGYFGPTDIVFHMMNKEDDGLISSSEFLVLNKYKKLPNLTRKTTVLRKPGTNEFDGLEGFL